MAPRKRLLAKVKQTAIPDLPPGFTKIPPQEMRQEDVKNSDIPPVYCNNFQVRGGPIDVWLCFNAVNPVGSASPSGQFIAERKATIVVSLPQFLEIAEMMSRQARALQEQVGQMAEEARKPIGQSST